MQPAPDRAFFQSFSSCGTTNIDPQYIRYEKILNINLGYTDQYATNFRKLEKIELSVDIAIAISYNQPVWGK